MDLTALRVKIVALRGERHRLEDKLMAKPGEMLSGPLVERYAPCGKPNCRCKKKGSKGHGPYYYAQIKIKGAYTNIYLGRNQELIEQARRYSEYIKDLARLRQINKEIDKLLEKLNRSKLRKKVK
ncbi:hypothetical protein A3H09_00300 [Candidatus Falkowbacteria bacterium RIFCSPLOWO2_12_FULL_45_13]|uniref:DUF6788 domain-containing protein n=1 Tax=Candidatus Falkowbacteria bacterium RIFCSPLOWO2_12_FULL_45_13 TaxID=1797991 RepID=A0A1F5T0X8_9BACT|nr:MAG: hypothetical protein A3H09_00300 [Candidatus Falkowbacteria bacterium RIFCSPLOWO2_12_FULL_45_13]